MTDKDLRAKAEEIVKKIEFLKEETFIVRRGESLLRRRVISGNNLESD